jgi:hypothetical protein
VGRGQLTGDPSFILGIVGFERRNPGASRSLGRFLTPERMFALSQEIVPVPLGAAPESPLPRPVLVTERNLQGPVVLRS